MSVPDADDPRSMPFSDGGWISRQIAFRQPERLNDGYVRHARYPQQLCSFLPFALAFCSSSEIVKNDDGAEGHEARILEGM